MFIIIRQKKNLIDLKDYYSINEIILIMIKQCYHDEMILIASDTIITFVSINR